MSFLRRIFRRSGDATSNDTTSTDASLPYLAGTQQGAAGGGPQQAFGELSDDPWPGGEEFGQEGEGDAGGGDPGDAAGGDSGGGDSGGGNGGGNGGGGGGE